MRHGLAIGLTLALLASQGAWAKSPRSKVAQRALLSSVRVEVSVAGKVARSASGVVIASDGTTSYVLTNAHVVSRTGLSAEPLYNLVIERPRLHRVVARLVRQGNVEDHDLALLSVRESLPVTQVAPPEAVDVGDDVVVVGAPYGRSLSVSSGIVSQIELDEQAASRVQRSMKTDAPIGYGSSGGGVFEVPSGRLVGLVEGYRTARVAFGGLHSDDFSFDIPMPGETFVAPPSEIRTFLLQAGVGGLAGIPPGPEGVQAVLVRRPSR